MTTSDCHASVLKRFAEVASTEYPFPKPQKGVVQGKRVNLKSFANLRPLLLGGVTLLWTLFRPLLFPLCLVLAFVSHGVWFALFGVCALVNLLGLAGDVFFLHYITDGRTGLGGQNAKDGIYCKDTPRNKLLSERLRRFVKYRPTPYCCSGDHLTIAPYVLFKGSQGGRVNYERWWVRVPAAKAPDGPDGPSRSPGGEEDEAVALDVAFPSGGYRPENPVFLVLHGLNGGSTEPYVLDLVRRASKEGSTVAVMVARGLSKTPLRGPESFTGARTSDVAACVDVLLHALGNEKREDTLTLKTRLVLVGFSMGGIVAANYTAKSKSLSGLAGAVSFSGTLCSEKMLLPCPGAAASLSRWQTALAWGLKATIVQPNQAQLFSRGLTAKDVENIRTVVDIDTQLVCRYHGYEDIRAYYEDMSACGRGDSAGIAKLCGAKVPLLAVHAIDDPIAIFEVAMIDEVPKTDHVMLLATKHGGHIGWPTGLFPAKHRWNFMVDIAMEFAAGLGEQAR